MGVSTFHSDEARRHYERGVKDALAGTVEDRPPTPQEERTEAVSDGSAVSVGICTVIGALNSPQTEGEDK